MVGQQVVERAVHPHGNTLHITSLPTKNEKTPRSGGVFSLWLLGQDLNLQPIG
jgi:hypothetical protein